jgi:hypothetical protein
MSIKNTNNTSIDQLDRKSVWTVIRRCSVFTLVAGALLTALDFLHIIFGVRTIGAAPYLTPIKFAGVGFLLALLSFIIDPQPHKSKINSSIIYGTLFAIGYASTAIFPGSIPIFILITLWFLQAYLMIKFNSSIKELIETIPFVVLLGTAGPLAEYIEVKKGLFYYVGATGIPGWLPLLWANGAFFLRALVGLTRGKAHIIAWLLTLIAPFARFIATGLFMFSVIRARGIVGAWHQRYIVLQLYGWKKIK